MRIPKKGLLDRQKLTKAFHAKLRAGTYIVSNCCAGSEEEFEKRQALGLPPATPDKQQFEEYVVTDDHREEQWKRIVLGVRVGVGMESVSLIHRRQSRR